MDSDQLPHFHAEYTSDIALVAAVWLGGNFKRTVLVAHGEPVTILCSYALEAVRM